MSTDLLNNICVILVEPLYPMNVGSVCRAMKNFGLSDLRLVHPPLDRNRDAFKMAHGATEILENAKKVFSVEEALEDVTYTVGTTVRLGGWRVQSRPPKAAAPEVLKMATHNKVAILFGSEDRGLENDVIKRCHALITVPTSKAHRSLNLAQAVLLIGYELFLAQLPPDANAPKLAPVDQVEAMFEDWAEVLKIIHFLRPGNPDYWIMAFKRLFGRTGLTTPEVNMFRGICRQIRWVASQADLPPREMTTGKNSSQGDEEPN